MPRVDDDVFGVFGNDGVVQAVVIRPRVVRETRMNPQLNLYVIGFIDDDPRQLKEMLMGVPVLGV